MTKSSVCIYIHINKQYDIHINPSTWISRVKCLTQLRVDIENASSSRLMNASSKGGKLAKQLRFLSPIYHLSNLHSLYQP